MDTNSTVVLPMPTTSQNQSQHRARASRIAPKQAHSQPKHLTTEKRSVLTTLLKAGSSTKRLGTKQASRSNIPQTKPSESKVAHDNQTATRPLPGEAPASPSSPVSNVSMASNTLEAAPIGSSEDFHANGSQQSQSMPDASIPSGATITDSMMGIGASGSFEDGPPISKPPVVVIEHQTEFSIVFGDDPQTAEAVQAPQDAESKHGLFLACNLCCRC